MLFYRAALLSLVIFLLAAPLGAAYQPQVIHGDILEVHQEEGKVRIASSAGMLILELASPCRIVRGRQEVSIAALRPIQQGWYQDGLFVLNSAGQAVEIIVSYAVREEDGFLVLYDIFGNIKMREPLER